MTIALDPRPRPILVTGMPRSGTTWLARLLATARDSALAGREPMNPGRRQYALAHTLSGWSELTALTTRQRRALTAAYRGRNVMVFSRYGRRQYAAPLPWTRLIVKDPFAMLSIPAVIQATGCVAVLAYRHPGAALVSYRRMGWKPHLDALAPVLAEHRRRMNSESRPALPRDGDVGEPEAMARFWSAIYEIALDNCAEADDVLVLSHEELAAGGEVATRRLFDALGLIWSPRTAHEIHPARSSGNGGHHASPTALHNFDRDPREVADEWRRHLPDDDIALIESVSAEIRDRLARKRLVLSAGPPRGSGVIGRTTPESPVGAP